MTDLDTFITTALTLADMTAGVAASVWGSDMAVRYKDDGSTLTDADLSVETRWREEIRRHYPSHGILGEEYGTDSGDSAYTWVLDPIDGTRQFGAGLLNYTSLIGLCRDGVPVLGVMDLPVPNARFVAAEGQGTRFGDRLVTTSGQTELAASVVSISNPESFQKPSSVRAMHTLRESGRVRLYDGGSPAYGALARGLIDVCLNGDDLDAFDICALCPIVQEAGGAITDLEGGVLSLESSGAILATASAALHGRVLNELAG